MKTDPYEWEQSDSIDLTDEGVLAEFDNYKMMGTEELALAKQRGIAIRTAIL